MVILLTRSLSSCKSSNQPTPTQKYKIEQVVEIKNARKKKTTSCGRKNGIDQTFENLKKTHAPETKLLNPNPK